MKPHSNLIPVSIVTYSTVSMERAATENVH